MIKEINISKKLDTSWTSATEENRVTDFIDKFIEDEMKTRGISIDQVQQLDVNIMVNVTLAVDVGDQK